MPKLILKFAGFYNCKFEHYVFKNKSTILTGLKFFNRERENKAYENFQNLYKSPFVSVLLESQLNLDKQHYISLV